MFSSFKRKSPSLELCWPLKRLEVHLTGSVTRLIVLSPKYERLIVALIKCVRQTEADDQGRTRTDKSGNKIPITAKAHRENFVALWNMLQRIFFNSAGWVAAIEYPYESALLQACLECYVDLIKYATEDAHQLGNHTLLKQIVPAQQCSIQGETEIYGLLQSGLAPLQPELAKLRSVLDAGAAEFDGAIQALKIFASAASAAGGGAASAAGGGASSAAGTLTLFRILDELDHLTIVRLRVPSPDSGTQSPLYDPASPFQQFYGNYKTVQYLHAGLEDVRIDDIRLGSSTPSVLSDVLRVLKRAVHSYLYLLLISPQAESLSPLLFDELSREIDRKMGRNPDEKRIQTCPICQDASANRVSEPCGHLFCETCQARFASSPAVKSAYFSYHFPDAESQSYTCPMCRTPVTKMHPIIPTLVSKNCKRCHTHKVNAVNLPCGHLNFCLPCASDGGQCFCYTCNKPLTGIIKVHL